MIKLTTQQISFFSKNGYIELSELFSPEECDKYLAAMKSGRDLFRSEPDLQKLLTSRQLSNIVFDATGKTSIRLACDHGFPAGFSLPKHEKMKDILCIQGIECVLFIQFESGQFQIPVKTSQLGILPYPKERGSAILVSPNVLINWPASNLGLYMAAYAIPTAVYKNNLKDPDVLALRKLGYGYGDHLKNETHPLLMKKN